MDKNKSVIISIIIIIIIAFTLFLFFKNNKNITDNDIKNIIKEELKMNVKILKSRETVNFRWYKGIQTAEVVKKEEVDYSGKWAKVRTLEETPIEFEIEVIKEPGKSLRIIGDNLDTIGTKITDNNVKKIIKDVYGWEVTIIDSKEVRTFQFDEGSRTSEFLKNDNVDYIGKWFKVKTIEKNPIEFEIEIIKRPGLSLRIIGDNLDKVRGK